MISEAIRSVNFEQERERELEEERLIRKIKAMNRESLQLPPAGWINLRDLAKELDCKAHQLKYILSGEKIVSLGENSWGNFLAENRHRAIYLSPQAVEVLRTETGRISKNSKAKEDARNFVDYLLGEQSKVV